jgi:nucleoside-diphosphate-sugar epimerase
MIGGGQNIRHPLYIEDMLLSFSLAMESDSAVGETFVIGGQRTITTAELVEAFCKICDLSRPQINLPMGIGKVIASGSEFLFSLFGKEPPISKRSLEFFHTNNSFNISKARQLLGFSPRYSFEEGLAESQQWLSRNV